MATDLFSQIYYGLIAGVGYTWLAWTILLFCLFAIVLILIELDILTALVVVSFPLLLLLTYQMITLGAWGLGVVVLVVGFVFGISIYKLFVQ